VSVCTFWQDGRSCPELATYRGRCDEHRHDKQRPSSTERGFDRKWENTRAAYLAAHPTCECDDPDCNELAVDVHHRDGRGPSGPRGHDWANLQALSKSHHSRVTAREQPGGWHRG
jgi:5-methylcytosine-specific restriction protein A